MPSKAAGSPKKGKKAPDWATDFLGAALERHEKLMNVTRLSATGLRMHVGRPKLVRVLREANPAGPTSDEDVAHADRDAALASAEVDANFPLLHGLATMALWSWLEDLVKGLLALWFNHRPSSLKVDAVYRVRVRLGDYLQLSRAEQAEFLVNALEQDVSSALRRGISRFNSLLDIVDLGVVLDEDQCRKLFEFQQVRNNLAHRSGVVDRRLAADCPWLNLKPGDPLNVSYKMLHEYAGVSLAYLLGLIIRVSDAYGVDARPAAEKARKDIKAAFAVAPATTSGGTA